MSSIGLPPYDPRAAIFTPTEASVAAAEAIRQRQTGTTRGLRFPIPQLRYYCQPTLPGHLVTVIAQTSNYKTGFLDFWAADAAQQLMDENRLNEAVAVISLEDAVEEQAYAAMSRVTGISSRDIADGKIQDWSLLEGAASKVGTIPIYRLGTSLTRPDNYRHLYWTNLVRSLDALTSGAVTGEPIQLSAIFVDYLQALPIDPEVQNRSSLEQARRLQVRNDIYSMRAAAFRYRCPVVCGVQAKQQLSGAPAPSFLTPGVYDGSEAQEIGQHPDRVYTLWMPKMTHMVGSLLDYRDYTFTVAEDMLWLRVVKQKPRLPAGRAWMLQIDFLKNNIQLHPWMEAQLSRQGETPHGETE